MRPGSTGLTVAAPVWKRFMTDAHEKIKEDLGEEEFEASAGKVVSEFEFSSIIMP
ncbi:MAG: hypothetical protein HC831_24020 [Chloroflexia bacterium]|nr:hypothetical protein [Chloroflexia bacterium]